MNKVHWIVEYVLPYINFAIFLAILVYFSRKPLSEMAKKRKNTFEVRQRLAAESYDLVKQELSDVRKKFEGLDREIANLRVKTLQDAQDEAKNIVEEGKRLAKQILDEAQKIRDGEFNQAQAELEKEITRAARLAVIDRLRSDFDETKDHLFSLKATKELSKIVSGSV